MARIRLISFAGYPYTPSSLMPDNGLASLAGSAVAAGHDIDVQDWSVVDTIERLFPRKLSAKVRPLAEKLFVQGEDLSWFERLRFIIGAYRLQRHQRRQIDAIAAEIARETEASGAGYLGLKLWNGDGFLGSVKIARAVRERVPDIVIIGGGPHVDYFGTHILDHTSAFDVLVRGEGERTLPELVDAMERKDDWRTIPGLVWREGSENKSSEIRPPAALNDLALPIYDAEVYPALKRNAKIRIGIVDESRGCPNRCAFCIHPIKSGRQWAVKSGARVVEEMQRLTDALDTTYFIYSGSNTSGKVAMDIADNIKRAGLRVCYGCFGHVRGIGRSDDDASPAEHFRALHESGCEAIFYGLESGSKRILRESFNKPLDLEEAERVITATREAGICAITSIIYPAPHEDAESRAETLNFLKRVRPDSVPITIPGVIPGTPWHKQAEEFGFEMADRKDLWEYALTYKIKLLFPPSLWKPLPYRVNGRSSKELFKECEAFIGDVEAAGLVTDVPHEMALMARALGEADDLKGFRDRCRARFLSGDVEAVADMVDTINANVRSQERGARATP